MIPLFIAGAIWTYNIVKICERVASDNHENDDTESEESEDGENATISNSAEAIRFIRERKRSPQGRISGDSSLHGKRGNHGK